MLTRVHPDLAHAYRDIGLVEAVERRRENGPPASMCVLVLLRSDLLHTGCSGVVTQVRPFT